VCAGTDDRPCRRQRRRIFSENLGSLSKKRKGREGFRLGRLRQMGFADPTSRGQNRSPVRDLEASKGSSPPRALVLSGCDRYPGNCFAAAAATAATCMYVLTLIILQLYICSCYTPLSAGAECFFCSAQLQTVTLRRMRKVFWEWRTHGSRDADAVSESPHGGIRYPPPFPANFAAPHAES
jgi:hypothetical protein